MGRKVHYTNSALLAEKVLCASNIKGESVKLSEKLINTAISYCDDNVTSWTDKYLQSIGFDRSRTDGSPNLYERYHAIAEIRYQIQFLVGKEFEHIEDGKAQLTSFISKISEKSINKLPTTLRSGYSLLQNNLKLFCPESALP